jgi:uncharacterized protein (DUF58 family)
MTTWRERLRRFFKPPRTLKFTSAGRVYVIVAVGVGLGALNTGNNLLYLLLGLLLSLIILSGVLSERTLRDVKVRRVLPDACHAGEPFALRYQVERNKGTGFALTFAEDGAALKSAAGVPYVEEGEPQLARANCVADKRGPLRLSGIRVATRWPFGLFIKARVIPQDDLLLVFPRRGFSCDLPPEHEGRRSGDGGNPKKRDGTGDVLGLRELQPNESARGVHWVKSAAVGKLLKVEREREERRQYTLEVKSDQPLEKLDRLCEEAAAMATRLLGRGDEVGLTTKTLALRPASGAGHEKRIMTALAWVGHEEAKP